MNSLTIHDLRITDAMDREAALRARVAQLKAALEAIASDSDTNVEASVYARAALSETVEA